MIQAQSDTTFPPDWESGCTHASETSLTSHRSLLTDATWRGKAELGDPQLASRPQAGRGWVGFNPAHSCCPLAHAAICLSLLLQLGSLGPVACPGAPPSF